MPTSRLVVNSFYVTLFGWRNKSREQYSDRSEYMPAFASLLGGRNFEANLLHALMHTAGDTY